MNLTDTIFYDIETYPALLQNNGKTVQTMRMSVAVTFDEKCNYQVWYENQIENLISHLLNHEKIVGFNIKSFDNAVLSQYRKGAKELLDGKSIDMLEIVEGRLGHRVSLQNIVEPTLNEKKSADGEQAIKWWLNGEKEKVVSYCKDDVKITKSLYDFGNEHKKILFNSFGQIREVQIDWENAEKKYDATEFTYQLVDDDSGNIIELDKNNKEFTQALEIAQTTNRLMYLTGRAGTGKTTFLKYLKRKVSKNTVVIAYTGVAAINAGGQTIHSFFQINPQDPPFTPNDNRLRFYTPQGDADTRNIFNYFHYNRAKIELLKKLELLIIDEVSMVRADFIDVIDKLLRAFSGRDRKLPFGGVQVIFIGDAFQLPPIEGQEWIFLEQHYESPFFFSSKVFRENSPIVLELKKIYRQDQKIEGDFISLLNRVRTNEPTQVDIQNLNRKVITFNDQLIDEGFICLCSENTPANSININRLSSLQGVEKKYEGKIEGEFNTRDLPTDYNLQLKVGAQVMFLKNGNGYYNGKIGKVTSLDEDEIIVTVKDSSGQENQIEVEKAGWENVRFIYNEETKHIEREVKGKFIQYPLKLAWAVTIHKSQGLTFDKVAIDVVFRGDFFKPSGLVYVALSRCRTWMGVVLNRELNRDSIHVDTRVVEFARQTTPSTLIDDAINNGKADSFYKDARRKISEGKPELAFESFLNAIKLRNDIETEKFKRYVIAYLKKGLLTKEHLSASLTESQILLKENASLRRVLENANEKIAELISAISENKSKIKSLVAENRTANIERENMQNGLVKLSKEIAELKNEIGRLNNLTWFDKLRGRK